ncbi:3,4-dihydroxy-2-butanone-4-phosphate synthase [Candidatus Micrarchaeota archaeon]|nr:3,4-dihydroxy-2-butanone-4-phosphate synthase [Candidatus Micrarchaeota archaeon]
MDNLERAAGELRKGNFILVYDGEEREGEADLIFHAGFATPEKIERLRRDAGGLICLALGKREAESIGLEFYTDILRKTGHGAMVCKKTAYGDEPAFSISVNHKKVYTGITDKDRALTIREMATVAGADGTEKLFLENFYSPGHVFLLIGRGLKNRRGHTELALELAERAGMPGTMVLCEMLGSGKALSKKDARVYAERHGFVFVEGVEIYEAGNR